MINYISSIIYIIIFIFSLYFIGYTVFNKTKSLPLKIVYSYLLYKLFTSVFGCIVKLFKLPFTVYFILMIIFWIGIYIYAIYKKKKNNIDITKDNIREDLKQTWFIKIIAIILIFFSISNIQYHWYGNHLDDGYYVNSVSDYVNGVDTHKVNPANGLNQTSKFDAYSLNMWEIESAFYAKLFHIDAAVFLKFAQGFIGYWLYAIIILAFLNKILTKEKRKKYKYKLQFIPICTILFMFQFDVLSFLINFISGWQFGNAMYYGSMLVRTSGIFLLLLPLIDKKKLTFKDIVIYGIISFILITQSSVALPVIIIVALAYLITYLLFEKKSKVILTLLVLLLLIIGIVLPNIPNINIRSIMLFQVNSKSIIFYVSCIVFLLGYLYKDHNIRKMNTILLLIFAFMYIPQINDITENVSVYDFVEERFWTGALYTVIVLAFAYAFIFFCKKFNKKVVITAECIVALLLVVGAYLSFQFRYVKYGGVIGSYQIVAKNSKLLPKSTIKLGQELEKLHKEKKVHLYVLTPDWVKVDKYDHSLAVLIRQYSPSSSIVSAIPRYHGFTNKEFKRFKQKDDDLYKDYLDDYKSNYNKFKSMLNKYPINCLVTEKTNSKESIESLGFKYEKKSCANKKCYYIYYKKAK